MKSTQDQSQKSRAAALLQATGELDDAWIAEAETEARARRTRLLHRISAIAACFVALAVLVPTSIFLGLGIFDVAGDAPNDDADVGAPDYDGSTPNDGADGDVFQLYTAECGQLAFLGLHGTEAHFELTLTTPAAQKLTVSAETVSVDPNGNTAVTTYYGGLSPVAPHADAILVENAVSLTVNGASATALPTEVGTYAIRVDLSALAERTDRLAEGGIIFFSAFPKFYFAP